MHSSRMRTARLLTVSLHALLGGVPTWRVVPARGGTCPGGVPTQEGVPAQGGVPAWVVYLPRGVLVAWVPAQGDIPAQGVYLPRYSPL